MKQPRSHTNALKGMMEVVDQAGQAHVSSNKLGTHEARVPRGVTFKNVATLDGWSNFLTGMGMRSGDRRTANRARWDLVIPEQPAEEFFATDPTARRIVELLPNDALRNWIEYKEEAENPAIAMEVDRLQLRARLHEAWVFARLYGGSGIFINDGTATEDLKHPLELDKIERIQSLTVLSRWELWTWATDIFRDITKPNFGSPFNYHIYPRMAFGQVAISVHASRIIRFDGKKLPRILHIRNNFWGDSALTSLYEAIGDYKLSHAAIANIIQDFRVLVQKVKGLVTTLAQPGGDQKVQKRMEIMNMARSVLGTYLIDSEDDFDFKTGSLAGVAELIDRVAKRLAAETDIPHSILFNEAAGGQGSMGSSGKHEERIWDNHVVAQQENYLRPRLEQIFKYIFAQRRGPTVGKTPEGWKFEFKNLYELDDDERASVKLKEAQAADFDINNQVITAQESRKQRFPDLAVQDDETLDLDLALDPGSKKPKGYKAEKPLEKTKPQV